MVATRNLLLSALSAAQWTSDHSSRDEDGMEPGPFVIGEERELQLESASTTTNVSKMAKDDGSDAATDAV